MSKLIMIKNRSRQRFSSAHSRWLMPPEPAGIKPVSLCTSVWYLMPPCVFKPAALFAKASLSTERASSVMCPTQMCVAQDAVLLTGPCRNRFSLYCGAQRQSASSQPVNKRREICIRRFGERIGMQNSPLPRKHYIRTYTTRSVPKEDMKEMHCLIDIREKKGVRGGRRSALVPHPEMISPDEALPARADDFIPIVVSQLDGLVHPTATVSQVRCLRCPDVCAQTLYVTLMTACSRERRHSCEWRGRRGDR